jgi:serine/threonine-protein kinase
MYTVGGASADGGEPVWVGRDGREELIAADWTKAVLNVALSPDGTQLAVSIADASVTNVWVRPLMRGASASKLTFDGETNVRPTWMPDGRSLLFISTRGGDRSLHARRADGPAEAELVLARQDTVPEGLLTRDGGWLVFRAGGGNAGNLYARRTTGDTTTLTLANANFPEYGPAISPNGRWLAYSSNETGRHEIYVRPFPEVSGGKWLVSVAGGTEALWSRDGRELFYRNAANEIVAVAVASSGAPPTGQQRVLFSAEPYHADHQHRTYDVTADGRRFVMIKVATRLGDNTMQLIVVENFFEELKRLVPRR